MLPDQDCALCAGACESLVCEACALALPRIANACAQCGIPLPMGDRMCGLCLRDRHAFDDAFAAFEYRFPIDRLVQRFKYAGDLALGRWLADNLAEIASRREAPDLVVATPLSATRLRHRGFNQALVIAGHVARTLRLRCEVEAVAKARDTPPQEGLDRRERLANLRDVFTCSRQLAGAHVALVDDVITTGATADAIARALRVAGASRVSVWAVARTPDPALR
jgi:ComF family protein